MEKSLTYAIAKAKKNIINGKYSKSENILDAVYQYYIREDEIETMIKSINKWITKDNNFIYGEQYTYDEIERIKKYL